MNKLEEYLKTPNPINFEYDFQHHWRQDDGDAIFPENSPSMTKYIDDSYFEAMKKNTPNLSSGRRTPMVQTVSSNLKQIKEKIDFSDNSSSSEPLQTPFQPNSRKPDQADNLMTTPNKKYQLRKNPSTFPKTQVKTYERSLRILTSQAYAVIERKGATTYKIVSEQIINNTIDPLNPREQNNIKRRVYDALNVLIALGKLEKRGRKIRLFEPEHTEPQGQMAKLLREVRGNLKGVQGRVQTKRQHKQSLQRKLNNLRKLLNRNQSNKGEQIVKMPFVGVISGGASVGQRANNAHRRDGVVKVGGADGFVYGDLDALNFVKFNKKQ